METSLKGLHGGIVTIRSTTKKIKKKQHCFLNKEFVNNSYSEKDLNAIIVFWNYCCYQLT